MPATALMDILIRHVSLCQEFVYTSVQNFILLDGGEQMGKRNQCLTGTSKTRISRMGREGSWRLPCTWRKCQIFDVSLKFLDRIFNQRINKNTSGSLVLQERRWCRWTWRFRSLVIRTVQTWREFHHPSWWAQFCWPFQKRIQDFVDIILLVKAHKWNRCIISDFCQQTSWTFAAIVLSQPSSVKRFQKKNPVTCAKVLSVMSNLFHFQKCSSTASPDGDVIVFQ